MADNPIVTSYKTRILINYIERVYLPINIYQSKLVQIQERKRGKIKVQQTRKGLNKSFKSSCISSRSLSEEEEKSRE